MLVATPVEDHAPVTVGALRDALGQPRLADPGLAADEREPGRRPSLLPHPLEARALLLTTDERTRVAQPPREHRTRRARGVRGDPVQGPIVGQDRGLQIVQPATGFESEFVLEPGACLPERLQRFGLAAGPVQREHQLAAQLLTERMCGRERAEPDDPIRVAPERELGLDVLLERRQPELFEPADLGLCERFVGDILECLSAPLVHRGGERGRRSGEVSVSGQPAPARGVAFEAREIERVRCHLEAISPGRGLERVAPVAERAAQPRHLHLQALRRLAPGLVGVQVVDETICRDGLIRMQQQQREKCSLPRTGEGHRPTVFPHLQRPQDPKLHR